MKTPKLALFDVTICDTGKIFLTNKRNGETMNYSDLSMLGAIIDENVMKFNQKEMLDLVGFSIKVFGY